NKVFVFSFTQKGAETAKKLKNAFENIIFYDNYKNKSLKTLVGEGFYKNNGIIFIGAAGIGVRAIAPYITTKDKDPWVIIVDEKGENIIPILSGHIGGGNKAALYIAHTLGGKAIITTATDINGVFAVDLWAKDNDLHINNIWEIKNISSAILSGNKIGFHSDYETQGNLPDFIDINQKEFGIVISDLEKKIFNRQIWLTPKNLVVGIGCRKGTDSKTLETVVSQLVNINLICGIGSIDLKKDEEAILKLAKKLNIDFVTYTAKELSALEGEFTASDFVLKTTGVDNVCERSAVLLSGNNNLILKKTATNGITVAIGKKPWRCDLCTLQ
ncbi:MAG: cobalt-precorrin 5A hydrolase, partial [Anaerotignaceae bacterium]